MEQFLSQLSTLDWLFLASAVFGGTLFIGRLIMSFMGMGDHHDLHHGGGVELLSGGHADGYTTTEGLHAGEHGELHGPDEAYLDFKFLSLQGLTAFFMMFGIIGFGFSVELHMPLLAIPAGIAAGWSMVWIAKKLFRFVSRFQSKGNVSLHNAIGNEGTVYLTLKPGDTGKVEILVQNRLQVLDARTEIPDETIRTGEKVRVVHVENDLLVVEKIPALPEEISLENIS